MSWPVMSAFLSYFHGACFGQKMFYFLYMSCVCSEKYKGYSPSILWRWIRRCKARSTTGKKNGKYSHWYFIEIMIIIHRTKTAKIDSTLPSNETREGRATRASFIGSLIYQNCETHPRVTLKHIWNQLMCLKTNLSLTKVLDYPLNLVVSERVLFGRSMHCGVLLQTCNIGFL